MGNLLKALKIVTGIGVLICIGIPLFLCMAICISITLWPIWFLLRLHDGIIGHYAGGYEHLQHKKSETMMEFICLCYGFTALFIYLPISIFDESV